VALVVEDGTGLATAEAYDTTAAADTYFLLHGDPAAWSGSTITEKEDAMRIGAQWVDLEHERRMRGERANEGQALAYPRVNVGALFGYQVELTDVPTILKRANFEAALRHREGDALLGDVAAGGGGVKSESVKVGPIEEAKEYVGDKDDAPSFPKITALLRPLLKSVHQGVRG
jgi:hypothetical protein